MVAFSTLEKKKNELIRKATGGSLFIAPSTAPTLTTLTGADGSLTALPAGWVDGGLMTEAGMQWARSVDLSEVTSFGQSTPTRSDVSSDSETVQVAFQEMSKLTIAMSTGSALAALLPDAASGELSIAKPLNPPRRNYRCVGIAVDSYNGADIYIGKYFPNATVTNYAEQTYAKGDAAIEWGVTLRSELDSTLGYAVKHFFGGPGFKALATNMGF